MKIMKVEPLKNVGIWEAWLGRHLNYFVEYFHFGICVKVSMTW